MGMGRHPALLPHPVLCVRVLVWQTAGAFALQAVQSGRGILQTEVSQDPRRGWIGSPRQDSLRSGHRHPLGKILAGRVRCDQGADGGVGTLVIGKW